MSDLAALLREAKSLPLNHGRPVFSPESDAFFSIAADKLEVVLGAVLARDTKQMFLGLEVKSATARGLEFATLGRFESTASIVVAQPIKTAATADGDNTPAIPPEPTGTRLYYNRLEEIPYRRLERRQYRLVRVSEGLFTLIGHVEDMRRIAISEAVKAMEGLKPHIKDIVEYVEHNHHFKIPSNCVREYVSGLPFLMRLFLLPLYMDLQQSYKEEGTPLAKALLWFLNNFKTIAMTFAITLLALLAIGIVLGLEMLWPQFQILAKEYGWFIGAPVLLTLFLIAIAFYLMKRWFPMLYGLSGVEVGAIACGLGLDNIEAQGWAAAYALAAGVFVMARGVEHFWEGLEKRREQRGKIEKIKFAHSP
jgi:hypothetical protein